MIGKFEKKKMWKFWINIDSVSNEVPQIIFFESFLCNPVQESYGNKRLPHLKQKTKNRYLANKAKCDKTPPKKRSFFTSALLNFEKKTERARWSWKRAHFANWIIGKFLLQNCFSLNTLDTLIHLWSCFNKRVKKAIYKTRNTETENRMRGMFTKILGNLLEDSGECYQFKIPRNFWEDSGKCYWRFRGFRGILKIPEYGLDDFREHH